MDARTSMDGDGDGVGYQWTCACCSVACKSSEVKWWLVMLYSVRLYARTSWYSCEARQRPRQDKTRHRKKHSERMSEARKRWLRDGASQLILVLVLCLSDPGLDTCYMLQPQVQVQGP